MTRYRIGDMVMWDSSSAGTRTRKTGQVVGVVKAGAEPTFTRFKDVTLKYGGGKPRPEESYIVKVVAPPLSKAQPRLYWPRVSALRWAAVPK